MERGVFIGGVLIAASLMIAVLLNSKSSRESEPAPATEDTTSQSVPKSVAMQPQSKLDAPARVSTHIASSAAPSAEPDSHSPPPSL